MVGWWNISKSMAGLRFKLIDHPSDAGIIAYGKNRKEIFENAAYGMFSLMADLNTVKPDQTINVKVKASDAEELLVGWLNELLFIEETKKLLCKEFKITRLSDKELEAQALGETIKPDRHTLYHGLKAATYNQLQIGKNQAKIVFDV
jgi:SHS2 domain-containing protein